MAQEKLVIVKQIRLRSEPDQVFRALTDPEEIVRVFPFKSVASEARPGGEITFKGETDAGPFTDYGRIEVFEPGRRFRYAYWSDNHGTPRTPDNHLTIDYELRPALAGETELVVTHGQVPAGPYHELMLGAWDHLLANLKAHLERSGTVVR
jgi:uncharacterized protein YndB with AHSA1/START domain